MTDTFPHPKITERRRQLGRDALKGGDGDGTLPPMEQRLSRVEDAIIAIRSSQDRMEQRFDRMEQRFDGFQSDMTAVKVSQVKLEERMERVMDKARDMPTEAKVNSMLNHKLTVLGVVVTAIAALAAWMTPSG